MTTTDKKYTAKEIQSYTRMCRVFDTLYKKYFNNSGFVEHFIGSNQDNIDYNNEYLDALIALDHLNVDPFNRLITKRIYESEALDKYEEILCRHDLEAFKEFVYTYVDERDRLSIKIF